MTTMNRAECQPDLNGLRIGGYLPYTSADHCQV